MKVKLRLIPPLADFATCWGPRYLVFMGGRGVGKTHALAARIILLTTRFKKFNYLVIVPNASELGEQIFDTLMENDVFRLQHVRHANSHNGYSIRLKNGSRIKIVSVARARISLRGKNINELAVEECQNREYTEAMFEQLFETMVRGASPVGNRGTILFVGQFGNEWIKRRLYDFGSATLDDGAPNPRYTPSLFRSWRVPASEGFIYKQPGGPEDYARRRQMAIDAGRLHAFNQEMECIPTASEYAAFSPEMIDDVSKHTQFKLGGDGRYPRPNIIETRPFSLAEYVVVVDPGRTTDPTGILVGDAFGNIADTDCYPRGQDHEVSARNACRLAQLYGSSPKSPALLVCMANEFRRKGQTDDRYAEIYKRHCLNSHVPFECLYEGGGAKQDFVDGLQLALQRKRIAIPKNCDTLLAQLKAYEFRKKKRWNIGGQMEYGAPEGQDSHDDLVSCLYGYVEALNQEWVYARGRNNLGVGAI